MNGYTGKILRLNLTNRKISSIPTSKYEHWVGGHGIGSAIFWDLVKDKKISGFDPRNVITIMTSPLSGTLAPGAAARTEVQGIGVQSYPIEWFTRSNFGGRFGSMLKFAGWDGIVIEGKADKPVWIDIRDGDIRIKDAGNLWGKDTWKTQQIIWKEVSGRNKFGDWFKIGQKKNSKRSTQKPAVLTIGPAGENLCRVGCLIHDAGNAAGQGGFGAVWGSKNLKAISIIGTGSIKIADPNALLEARLWSKKHYSFDLENPDRIDEIDINSPFELATFGTPPITGVFWQKPQDARPQACIGCHSGCRRRHGTGQGNESSCIESLFYSNYDLNKHSGIVVTALSAILKYFEQKGSAWGLSLLFGNQTSAAYNATDLAQKYGINACELLRGIQYIRDLNKMGVFGPGMEIDCDLPFDKLGEPEFIEKLLHMIAYRKGIGNDMAEGFFRAAQKWGRLEKDSGTGLLLYPYWGLPEHGYDPRVELEWGYGSILGERDINEHGFNFTLFWLPSISIWSMKNPPISAKDIARIYSDKMLPYDGDPLMVDYSTGNMYSEHIVKLIAWHRHYSRFWKQSVLYCDWRFPDFYNTNSPDKRGLTGVGEPKFFNAVTGKNLDFTDGIELGKKIWTLDNAIWTLQGRHRDMVHFADYIYKIPFGGFSQNEGSLTMYYMPGKENGEWKYIPLEGRHIDKEKFEEWKTKYYTFEGWDPKTGWPTEKTLKSIGLAHVANELKKNGRLGKG